MSSSIKATCPNCRKLIRIPLDWAERAMKCKKCGTLVQMKKKDSPTPASDVVPTAAPAKTVPVYEPTYEAPAPQPYYAPPPQPTYAPPPAYEAHPYGYPSPYPMPPQYGPQPPAYGYSYPPQPQYAPPPQQHFAPAPSTESTSFLTASDTGPSRRRYQRGGNNTATKIVMFSILAIVVVGIGLIAMKMANTAGINGSAGSSTQVKDEPNKRRPPPENTKPTDSGTGTSGGTPATPSIVSDPFPRRMLFMHLSKYVYFNNLSPGVFGRGEDMPTSTASKLAFELRVPNDQVYTFVDTGPKPPPTHMKHVMLDTFQQFFATSRDMDRIIVYFGGHAREVDGKAYLVPVDGDPDDATTLLPLDEVYNRLAACKAQQKIVIWDVCRFNPGVGSARAGSEKMTEGLLTKLHAAPTGVTVLTSCSAGQNSQESSENGSAFLGAFRAKAKQLQAGAAAQPGQAIAIDKWSEALREQLAKNIDPQTLKATLAPPGNEIAYSKEAPPAKKFDWPPVPPGANPGEVNSLINAFNLPGIRKEIELPQGLSDVYPFSAEVLKQYADDGKETPLRKTTKEAMAFISAKWKFGDGTGLRESLSGAADDSLKKEILKEQGPLAVLEAELSEQLGALERAGKQLADEKSKRWQALYQYALAQVQLRWAFINEYNLVLGNIRTDNLEKPAGDGMPVYRLVSTDKMKSKKDITEKVDAAKETLEKLGKDHKGTPLEILAKMNKNVSLGLAWKLEVQASEEKIEEKK